MGASFESDLNVISAANSSTTLLGASEAFQGTFVDVTNYTSVTVSVSSDAASLTDGIHLEWSMDGVNVHQHQHFTFTGPSTTDGISIHSTTRLTFFRIRYENGFTPQTTFVLETLLRKGTPSGTVSPIGTTTTSDADAETSKALLMMRSLDAPSTFVYPFATGDPFVIVTSPPNRSTHITQHVAATTFFAPQLDFFGIFATTRRTMTVFNDTKRGNLYIDSNSGVTATTYTYKVPPQHLWTMPEMWIRQSGGVWGIWDVADGTAHVMELF